MTLTEQIEQVVAAEDFGTASGTRTSVVRNRAFATRDEAVADAERHIETFRRHLAVRLARPELRMLRQQYGLPGEIPSEWSWEELRHVAVEP